MQDKATVTIPEQLTAVITTNNGIEPTKSELYAMSFAPFMAGVNDLIESAKTVNKETPTDEDIKKARRIRLDLVPFRTGADKKKDDLKAALLVETNLIQSLFNVVKSTSQMTEAEMLEVETTAARIEAERKAKLKAERAALLDPFVDEVNMFPLGDMEQAAFDQLLEGQKLAHAAKIAAEKAAEEARIEAARKEAEEREAQRLENERLKKEAEAREKQLEYERKAAAKKQAEIEAAARKEREALEAKLKAEQDAAEKARKEAEEKQAEIDRKEREAKAAAEKAEADRLAAEKKAASAPDKEKLIAFKSQLDALKIPELKTKEAAQIAADIKVLIGKIKTYIDDKTASI